MAGACLVIGAGLAFLSAWVAITPAVGLGSGDLGYAGEGAAALLFAAFPTATLLVGKRLAYGQDGAVLNFCLGMLGVFVPVGTGLALAGVWLSRERGPAAWKIRGAGLGVAVGILAVCGLLSGLRAG